MKFGIEIWNLNLELEFGIGIWNWNWNSELEYEMLLSGCNQVNATNGGRDSDVPRGCRFLYIELQLEKLCRKCKGILKRLGGRYKIRVDSLGKAGAT